ncbi:sensor histidine kinase [Streptosporangium sp. NPDC050855]|uniref:sensor histidine kinase n=1 Tax=Streptosporangium sp. NPDC050855 TaxID=3366194 RepID=UPI003797F78C
MRAEGVRDRLTAAALPVAAFCAAFVPDPRPYAFFDLASVPAYLQGVVVGLVAAATAWASPRRHGPLLLVVAVDSVVRSPGFLLSVASYVVATTWRRPSHLAFFAVAASLLAALPRPGADLLSSLGGAPLFVWFPLAIGLWTGARRQVVAGLRERAERLEREQAARAARARAQERARIARDMHDVVAHRVSLMVLRAGALEIGAADARTAAEAELIRVTGKEALEQLRAVLGVLTDVPRCRAESGEEVLGPRPTPADLDRLLDLSRSAGVPVERRDEGTVREVPVIVQHAVHRVVQEALTNVHKHAGTAATRVVLRYLPSALEVTVANSAPVDGARAMPGSGLGLIGLRERVELLGGGFTAGREADGGFRVSARLPT